MRFEGFERALIAVGDPEEVAAVVIASSHCREKEDLLCPRMGFLSICAN